MTAKSAKIDNINKKHRIQNVESCAIRIVDCVIWFLLIQKKRKRNDLHFKDEGINILSNVQMCIVMALLIQMLQNFSYVMFAAKTEVLIKTGTKNLWLMATP